MDEEEAEAVMQSPARHIEAVQAATSSVNPAFVNAAGLSKLRQINPLPTFDGTPGGWDAFAQGWHDAKDLHLLGVPAPMHYRVLAQCCPSDLQKDISGWVRDDPKRTVDDVFALLRAEFQVSDAFGDTHTWESLKLDAPGGRLTLAVWGTWKREWDRLRSLVAEHSSP